jgi:plastocyanin
MQLRWPGQQVVRAREGLVPRAQEVAGRFLSIKDRERPWSHLLWPSATRTTSCPGHQSFSGDCLGLVCVILLLSLASSVRADVIGTVTLVGKPNSHDETFVAQANGCGESPVRRTENWKIGPKGELGDVVVWIVDPKFQEVIGARLPPEIVLKQIGCRYIPHVAAVQAGVNFAIVNCDPTLHNVRAKVYDGPGNPPGADVFNFGQPTQGQTDEREFDDPGIYTLQCDVHAWMQCWVMVLKDDVFGVTDLDGKFKLQMSDVLADGDYKIDAWHPRFAQTLEQTIHVKNGTANVNFQFDGTKSF